MALTNGDSKLGFKDFKWESDELGYGAKERPRFVRITSVFQSQYFNASYRLSIEADAIFGFIQDLEKVYKTLKGRAQIIDLDDHLECCISPNRQGQIEVSGYIQTSNLANQMLFKFVTDQTFLPTMIRELKTEFTKLKSS